MSLLKYSCLGLTTLVLSLTLNPPVFAQQAGQDPSMLMNRETIENSKGGFEHQRFREEMGELRKEHEELEAEREKLHEKCADNSSEVAETCEQEKRELHERMVKLHDRTHAFHERMNAQHKEPKEHGEDHTPAPTNP